MALTATASPSAGPTPGTFILQVSGAKGAVTVAAEPSPPNPNPMPPYTITPLGSGTYEIEITGSVGTGVQLHFVAIDEDKQTDVASYTST